MKHGIPLSIALLLAVSQAQAGMQLSKDFSFGPKAVGRFGQGSNINTPPGDLLSTVTGSLWVNHLAALNLNLGVGVNNLTFVFGAGAKLNLLEMSSGGASTPLASFGRRGGDGGGSGGDDGPNQKGFLGGIITNFMIFASVDYNHYSFPDPATGLTYAPSAWVLEPGAGTQWYAGSLGASWARRFYLQTSVQYAKIAQSNFLLPFIGLGVELR